MPPELPAARLASLWMAASRDTSSLQDQDPILEIMGWRGEPLLLRRLGLHMVASAIEAIAIAVGMYLSELYLQPSLLFIRLLAVPLVVVIVKLVWSCHLAWGYLRMSRADLPTAMRRMGCQHSRSLWSCSVAAFTCCSCLLLVWHAILFLLVLCYESSDNQELAVRYLLSCSAICGVVNWLFWRDTVRNYSIEDETEFMGLRKLLVIWEMYKQKVIVMMKLNELPETQDSVQICCPICLEQFKDIETVARLPCGHLFHPPCVNKWLLEDWRCPFRCSLEHPKSRRQTPVAWASAEASAFAENIGTGVQPRELPQIQNEDDLQVEEIEDLELGRGRPL
eukprot:TRINITY_DN112030_c0_g1_i1.p1 TRINITY_DN112030_c0_g1~~TRINITY_DN112030_c0_g1_i1.p1  ORF type:complete len:337 (+),score=29.70 TRINITY_DN112030_c0_g1_i1:63-1073(+)